MIKTQFTLDDIVQMTMEVGEDWAVAHAKRLIELVKLISGIFLMIRISWNWQPTCMIGAHFQSTYKRMWNMRFVPDRWLNLTFCLISI